jgi:hypothetical protein
MKSHTFSRPSSVTTPLLIDCGDVQIDAYGTYDAESGWLESVTINKREFTVAQVSAALFILCPDDVGPWADDLDGDTLNVLLNESAADYADEYGDWKLEQMKDAGL